MKTVLLFLLIAINFSAQGQNIPEVHPSSTWLLDLSPEGEKQYVQDFEKSQTLLETISSRWDTSSLSEQEKDLLDKFDMVEEVYYWEPIGPGCSWYCGGGLDTNSASSVLKTSGRVNYQAKNIHDNSFKTAWVEGVEGFGIGESITYHFPPQNPRVTTFNIANGYVKSEQAWKDNTRVKKLKVYYNDEPLAILLLEDIRGVQEFKFDPLGYGKEDRENTSLPWWTLRFEILEVYPGEQYDDTAISEIYFDGIDVH